jgi:glycosyltransferase involved in cell wall biosynthesis
MRIAYVCTDPGVPVFGTKGCSVHVQEVVRSLVRRGHTVELFCTSTGGAAPADLAGVPVQVEPVAGAGALAARERAAATAERGLAVRLGGSGPFDLVYERYALWGRAAQALSRTRGIPSALEVNAPLVDEQARYRGLVHRTEAEAVARSALSDASVVVAVSDQVAAWARRNGADAGRVHVVPNGVDTARVLPAQSEPRGAFTVGFVGTLKPWHGLRTLVDAFARLAATAPDSRLLIVGDGPEAATVRGRAEALGLRDRVELAGARAPADVPALLHRMHVAVAPYPRDPGTYFSPLKVFEYLAAGLPVVASRVGQVAQLITDESDGVLVPPDDPAALADALLALRSDPVRRARLGASARRTAVARHRWDAVVDRVVDLAVATPPRAVA